MAAPKLEKWSVVLTDDNTLVERGEYRGKKFRRESHFMCLADTRTAQLRAKARLWQGNYGDWAPFMEQMALAAEAEAKEFEGWVPDYVLMAETGATTRFPDQCGTARAQLTLLVDGGAIGARVPGRRLGKKEGTPDWDVWFVRADGLGQSPDVARGAATNSPPP